MNLAEMLRKVALRRAAADARKTIPAKRGAPPAILKRRLTPDATYAYGGATIHHTQYFRAHRAEKASGK